MPQGFLTEDQFFQRMQKKLAASTSKEEILFCIVSYIEAWDADNPGDQGISERVKERVVMTGIKRFQQLFPNENARQVLIKEAQLNLRKC